MLLERYPIKFETLSPDTDETAKQGELPRDLVRRLALEKARSVSQRFPDALVIGSDQLAECGDQVAGKPGDFQRARKQLSSFSGHTVNFLSAFAIVCETEGFLFEQTVNTEVVFRNLGQNEIDRYLLCDEPYDCAGSFRSEATGPSLLERMTSDDPTAIMGLPLIALAEGLRQAGVYLP